MGWFEDAVDVVVDVVTAPFEAIDTTATFIDDTFGVIDTMADIGGGIAGGIADVYSAGYDAFGAGLDFIDTTATFMDDQFGIMDTVDDFASVAEDVFDEVGDPFLTAMEDSGFFDVLEVATLTIVDVEYSDAGLSVDYGIDNLFGGGISIGENGVHGHLDAAGSGIDAGYGSKHGLNASGSLGWDYGPLPSADAHLSIDEQGQLGVGGRVEAYLPTPAGMSGGEVGGDYQETPEGFRMSGTFTARNFAPSGTYAGAGAHFGYEENDAGYLLNVGVHGEVGQLGGPEVYASVDYNESRQGDVSMSGVSVSGSVSAPGVEAEAELGYTHVETSKGEYDVVTGSASGSAGGVEASGSAAVVSGPDGVSVSATGDVDLGDDPMAAANALAGAAGVKLPDGADLGLPDPSDLGLPDPGDLGVPDVGDLAKAAGLPDGVDVRNVADAAGLPDVAGMAEAVGMPQVADMARAAGVPEMPDLPDVPDLPVVPDLPEVIEEVAPIAEAVDSFDDALSQATEIIEDQ